MENITKALENINSESEKVGYDPKIGTNWCHLPMEMQAECMKHMGFRTRTRLRATSSTEKKLVDSEKFKLKAAGLDFLTHLAMFSVDDNDGCYIMKTYDYHRKTLNFMDKILELSEMPCLRVITTLDRDYEIYGILDLFRAHAPLQFKVLSLISNFPSDFPKFLRSCDQIEQLSLIDTIGFFNFNQNMIDIQELMEIPAVQKAGYLKMKCSCEKGAIHQIIQKWIDVDAEVGTTLVFHIKSWLEDGVEELAQKFRSRVVSQNDTKLRIRTDNVEKHVLMKIEDVENVENVAALSKVIAANLPESEEDDLLEKIKK